MRKGHISNVVERAIVQFRFNQTLELADGYVIVTLMTFDRQSNRRRIAVES